MITITITLIIRIADTTIPIAITITISILIPILLLYVPLFLDGMVVLNKYFLGPIKCIIYNKYVVIINNAMLQCVTTILIPYLF